MTSGGIVVTARTLSARWGSRGILEAGRLLARSPVRSLPIVAGGCRVRDGRDIKSSTECLAGREYRVSAVWTAMSGFNQRMQEAG